MFGDRKLGWNNWVTVLLHVYTILEKNYSVCKCKGCTVFNEIVIWGLLLKGVSLWFLKEMVKEFSKFKIVFLLSR